MTLLDSMIVMIYLLFIGIAASLFRRFSTSSNDFLQGGGTMMWWMAGATAFMTQFSAWTFTGAAAKAYEDGISVMFIFWGNALGFFVAAAFFARRYRRLRVETAMEVIRVRFGHTSEQLFTWLSFPLTLIACAIWMNGLASFFSAVFAIEMSTTILAMGVVVTLIAVSGGAWTVSVTNVIQLILLIAITLVIGYTALQRFDSPSEVFAHATPIYGEQIRMPSLFVMWATAMLLQQTMSNNHTLSCYRFLTTANDKDATKAAFVAGVLFVFSPVLWFMPAWFVAAQNIDLLAIYPALEQSANNAAYLYYIQHYMPQGLLGLVMVALVAATIAPLSSAHNRNAGIVVKSLYQVWFNPNATSRQQLMVGKIATIVSGVLATVTALLLASVESYSLFDMMIVFAAFIQVPINIPSLLALVSLKTPNWSGWATVMVGCAVSLFMMFIFDVQWLSSSPLTPRESKDLSVVATLAVHLLVTGGFFLFTRVFYAKESPSIQQSRTALAIQLATPISDEEQSPINHKQGLYVGSITALAGMLLILAGVVLAVSSQSIFVAIGCIVLLFSLFLLQPTLHSKRAWQKQKTK
ncbi:transporter [Vibrio parahaemolyticus]|uniref:sodium:solute symporter family transporter n=1 Tax=Vibrio parahaemolyticus TaxID=670 RepID=UPI001D9950F6|nr:transporter [Vibrio parahaemolyticus]EJG1725491.1 transporter [Vibrio parahaemolyticus]EJG1739315.1 transporter [Vibrio parahaemolyticus]EJG1751828.1 transporter [Vibrio parahaemolyticus]EJG1756379.1 transporter [Vibrio parahaemolyticus]UYW18073.1 transporter [Vibrio parahaemolyticus]